MNETGHDRWRDELAAYLLGALEPGEAAELERHLAGCEECRSELELAAAGGAAAARVGRAGRALAAAARSADGGGARRAPSPRGPRASKACGAGAGRPCGRSPGWLRWRWSSPGSPPTRSAAAAGDSETTTVVGRQGPRGDREDGPRRRLRHAAPGEPAPAAARRGAAGLGPARRARRPAKTLFVPNPDGTATATIDDMEGVDAVMVTAEPRGGSAQPTSAPIVNVAIPN